jgi:hypothetical protein
MLNHRVKLLANTGFVQSLPEISTFVIFKKQKQMEVTTFFKCVLYFSLWELRHVDIKVVEE